MSTGDDSRVDGLDAETIADLKRLVQELESKEGGNSIRERIRALSRKDSEEILAKRLERIRLTGKAYPQDP